MNIRVCIICCFIVLVGCARNDGRKTFEFLKAERDIIDNAKAELNKCSSPKPPSPLAVSKSKKLNREQLETEKAYHIALDQYLSLLIQNSQQAERILNDTETKISGLNSSGVGEDAINLTKSYEQSFGDTVQLFVEVEALAKLDQNKLRNNQQSKLFAPFIAGILDAATGNPATGADVFLKSVSNAIKQEIEQDHEAQSHFIHLQEASEILKHDVGDAITKRSELITSYGAKYPEYSWNLLLPATQSAK
jgi:hypothetical protein